MRKRSLRTKFRNREFRQAYVDAHTESWLCYQIRALRQQRGWSQAECARRLGMKQSVLSRLECEEGKITLKTIMRLAAAFDVAPLVRFVSHKRFERETKSVSPRAMYVRSYANQ